MKHKLAGSLAAVAVLTLGIAACSSSSPTSSSGSTSGSSDMGKTPLTIVTTPISPMIQNFNPFVPTSTGYVTHAVNLYDQPLMVFNTQNTSAAPVPELATHYAWSNGGETLTITTQVRREVE